MSAPTGIVVYCGDCGKPWGVRGHGQADVLVAAFRQWWADRWADDVRGTDHAADPVPPTGPLPPPVDSRAVFVSAASLSWLYEIGYDPGVEEDCWYREADHPLPRWWVEPRLRPFTTWDCCSLPSDPWDAAELYREMAR